MSDSALQATYGLVYTEIGNRQKRVKFIGNSVLVLN
jgi:hypothetical protein